MNNQQYSTREEKMGEGKTQPRISYALGKPQSYPSYPSVIGDEARGGCEALPLDRIRNSCCTTVIITKIRMEEWRNRMVMTLSFEILCLPSQWPCYKKIWRQMSPLHQYFPQNNLYWNFIEFAIPNPTKLQGSNGGVGSEPGSWPEKIK